MNMSQFVAAILLLQVYGDHRIEFNKWKELYEKQYSSNNAESDNYNKWIENREYVRLHNNNPERQYDIEMNMFADKKPFRSEAKYSDDDGSCPLSKGVQK